MSRSELLDAPTTLAVLAWAAQRQLPLAVSLLREGHWSNLRSQIVDFDPRTGLLRIVYPVHHGAAGLPEIGVAAELGVSFRRGHKKCVLVGDVVLRAAHFRQDGTAVDTLVLRMRGPVQAFQRRAFQRVIVPPDRFVAVKLWEGGLPAPGAACWAICAGRLSNISVGGLLVDIRADHNPHLRVGDAVGVEIFERSLPSPLTAEAQYRHCSITAAGRIGLGLQFIGLEHNLPGRAAMAQLATYVAELRRTGGRIDADDGDQV